MNVAMICQPWDPVRPPVTSGSVAIWVYEISRRLAKTNDVTVYAQHAPGDKAVEHHEGVEYRRFPLGRTGRLQKLKHFVTNGTSSTRPFFASNHFCEDFINAIAQEVHDRKYDVVHIQNYSQYVTAIRKRCPDVRIVLHMRCEWLLQLDYDMLKDRVGQADLVISVGDYLNKETKKRFPDAVTEFMTLANGVNLTYFESILDGIDTQEYQPKPKVRAKLEAPPVEVIPQPEKVDSPIMPMDESLQHVRDARGHVLHLDDPNIDEELVVLFVSRISPEKGVHDLLKAFERVHAKFPMCKLRLIGPPGALSPELMLDISTDPRIHGCAKYFRGDYLEMLKQEMPRAIADSVEFLGHVPHDELPGHYWRASLVVAPSLSEAFGRAPVEAMACGVPVVGTTVGGIAETVVPFETGLLVPPCDPDQLADAMIQLLADPELRVVMGVNGWKRVAERYTWDSIARRTEAYYQELLASRTGAVGNADVQGRAAAQG